MVMNAEELATSMRIVDYFLKNNNALGQLSMAEGRDIMQMASYTAAHCAEIGVKNKCYDILYSCCYYLKEIDIKELWNIYWILNVALFRYEGAQITGSLDELYRLIYKKIESSVTDTYERTDNSGSNLVVVVTNQVVTEAHAPTRRVLDYSYAIATALHKRVMIINDASFHFYQCACLEQIYDPAYMSGYTDLKEITYKGLRIPFMQFPGYMPDLYGINEMLRQIYQMQPELGYNISDSCLVSDLCRLFTKTACVPCSNNIPVTMSEYLLVGRELEDTDKERLARLEPYQKVIETLTNYELPETTIKYERTEFGISDDSFLIGIIGNRLDKEMTDEFILVMDKILNRLDVHFMVIGLIYDTKRIENGISKSENLHFTGDLKEAVEALRLCNVYLNPKRMGGGRSSFEALAVGVPVITVGYGDVHYTCGDEFVVDSYDDYLERINRYITDADYYQAAREKSLKRAEELSDIPGTQRKVFEKIFG